MLGVNLLFFLILLLLAIISRKNFTKYKACKSFCFVFLLAIGETIYEYVMNIGMLEKLKPRFRKIFVMSDEGISIRMKQLFLKYISFSLVILILFNIVSAFFCIYEKKKEDTNNIITRAGYMGNPMEQTLYLRAGEQSEEYSLIVEPLEYTEERFLEEAKNLFDMIEVNMLGDNKDAQHICSDLFLMEEDENGLFEIEWSSSNPEIVTYYGQVNNDELLDSIVVTLTATVKYLDYEISNEYPILVRTQLGNDEKSIFQLVGEELDVIEQNNRNSIEITIPHNISGVEISVSNNRINLSVKILLLGFLICSLPVGVALSRLFEKEKHRDNMLINQYAFFVNKLWLMLGTGMTIRSGMARLCGSNDDMNILTKEIQYTLREIEAGVDEAGAYEQLGIRLSLPGYQRLMSHISQNLQLGTRDLSGVLEDEVHSALQARKELAAKRGEEASTKLLFPMILLLIMVMVIMIIPALITL